MSELTVTYVKLMWSLFATEADKVQTKNKRERWYRESYDTIKE